MGARAVGPWVGEQKPLGKTPRRGNPSAESTYLCTVLPQRHLVKAVTEIQHRKQTTSCPLGDFFLNEGKGV